MNHPDYPAWRDWLEGLPAGVPTTQGSYLLTVNAANLLVLQGQLQTDKLVQPFAKPALIEGIRFRAEFYDSAGSLNTNNDEILSLQARVWVGPFSLTNDFVTVGVLAVREQYVAGEVVNYSGAPGALLPITRPMNPPGAQYTWYFKEPLYLPPGVPMRINLQRVYNSTRDSFGATAGQANVNVTTSAAIFGRYFPENITPPPGPVPIPYGATYVDPTVPGSAVDLAAAVAQVASSQTDLCNQTSDVLFMDKFLGKLPMRDVAAPANPTCGDYEGPEPLVRITRTYNAGADSFARANNRALVDPFRPFNTVFGIHSRALDLTGVEMPPGSAFLATVLKRTRVSGGSVLRIYPALGITGMRMEKWQ